MKIVAIHTSASAYQEKPHAIELTRNTISDAVKRRAQSVIDDRSIDPRWRAVIRYGLETNDPWLADLVRRADAREKIIDAIGYSQTLEAGEDDSNEEKIEALAEIICQASDQAAAALLVLMGTLENSTKFKVLANSVKHYAFARCGELNLFAMVDSQIAVIEETLLASSTFNS
jgi:hypothetical protein